ncbi:MAG: ATP-binding protein [Myxococcota bacterium]|nr:ATP-binding protein [Myxococcota bacterium]
MASVGKGDNRPVPRRLVTLFQRFSSIGVILGVLVPIAVITAIHYGTSHEHHWVHDVMRRAYYLPIVVAAIRMGLLGGLASATLVTGVYVPHAFLVHHHFDPARNLEKILEIALYYTVAVVAGYLSDRENQRNAELQQALDEQQSLTKQLVRAGRLSALGEVVAGIAHEIKNPLHALAGTAEIVDPIIPQDANERRMWDIHRREIERLGRVAEQFLSFAKPKPIKTEPIDLVVVAKRFVTLVDAQARQKGIQISIAKTSESTTVFGDLDQLAQICLNIAVNAIKAMDDHVGGQIEIRMGRETLKGKSMAFLRIENNGPAIDEVNLEHLFDPFHSGGDGAGLGLSISSQIAEQHSGFIEAENTDMGVAFTLYLPT